MNTRIYLALAAALIVASASAQQPTAPTPRPTPAPSRFHEPTPFDFDDHTGFVQIFDGKTLAGWDGDPAMWRVEDGVLIGESPAGPRPPNTYISYHGTGPTDATAHDFDLKLEIKVELGGGTGIQYRSSVGKPWIQARPGQVLPKPAWLMTGPQADFWFPVDPQHDQYSGQFYSENTKLGILSWRGQITESEPGSTTPQLLGEIGNRAALGGYVVNNGWNQYEIIARGPVMMHLINGQLMAVYIDDDPTSSNNNASGLIGIELESNPTKISVRNIWLRKLN
jgi:hypothetical protein